MKIRDVVVHVLEAKLTTPFAYSQAWYDSRMAMLVEIVTEDGVSGFGECYGPAHLNAAIVEKTYKPLLIGADALATERIWQQLYNHLRDHGQKGLAVQALSGVDIALWDLKGRHFGVPVHRLMGGPIRTDVQAYATGLYRRRRDDHEKYLREEAADYAAQGFTAMKLKVGFGFEHDVRITKAVRSEIGPAIELAIDANHGYDALAAIKLGRAFEDQRIAWFEEPVLPEDIAGYKEVKAALTIPVAGGECEFTRYGFRTLLAERAVDILQPDTCAAGGLSECKKIADMALAHSVRYIPHCWGTGIAASAALQLLAVLPHSPPGLWPGEPLLEFDRSEHPLRDVVLTEPIRHDKGRVKVPSGPGLGVEISRDALRRFRVN